MIGVGFSQRLVMVSISYQQNHNRRVRLAKGLITMQGELDRNGMSF